MSIAGIADDIEATAEEKFGYGCFVEP